MKQDGEQQQHNETEESGADTVEVESIQQQEQDQTEQQDNEDDEQIPGSHWEDDMFLNQMSPPGEPWTQMTREDLQR